ncbi:MAG: response regulator [Ardenticatenaceae bacterium]|nr:response regulator [Anaerolineales bacterium]MCB8969166.1 response regulator [Ardenticatenaceae bacterium]MCB8980555.1 response regulator [Ardenticatenaceae bacterium]
MIELMMPQPSAEFIDDVKVALEHLYDFAFLQKLELAQLLSQAQHADGSKRPSQTLGHLLRRELIEAIEALSPEPGAAAHTPDTRQYHLLQLHYVEGLTVQEVGQRLGLSTRQTHRSLRKAEESVATILWARVQSVATAVPENDLSAAQLSSVQAEFAQLETTLHPTDLAQLLHEAQKAVAPLAQTRGVTFQLPEPWPRLVVSVDTAVSRQLLVSVLSRLIQATQQQTITIQGALGEEMAELTLAFPASQPLALNFAEDQVIAPLAERLGWEIATSVVENGRYQLQLQIPLHGPVVLVVDDNQGLVELLERYLTGHNCRVIAANSGKEGLEVLNRTTPDAIILDAMMPDVSGWDVLQTIRTRVETAVTPVIICSVFNDPELAYALGASHFISKPVSRDQILTALRQLNVV